ELIRQTIPMLAQASGLVGDAQVRHRGTIGGALVHADPAGDLPAVASALGGSVVATSLEGTRTVPITELFTSVFETVLDPAEVVTAVRFPVLPGVAQYYEKFRRRLCDWAIVGSAVSIRVEAGTVRSANVYLTNVGSTPTRARAVEEALVGAGIDEQALRKACDGAGDGLDPTPELNASAEYKKHLAGVITRRALENALASRPA